MIFNTVLNFLFGPIISLEPALSIFIISTLINGIILYVNRKTIWSEDAKKVQEKMKESEKFKKEIKGAQKKKDVKKVEQLTKKSLELQSKYMSEYMKYSIKPLLVSILLAIMILPWFNSVYGNNIVFTIPEFIPLIGGIKLKWLWWYIICTLSISLLGKKLFEGSK